MRAWHPPAQASSRRPAHFVGSQLTLDDESEHVANHKSAEKRIRQNAKRAERNRYQRSTMRTYVKRVRTAIDAGDKDAAADALCIAVKQIAKAASKGVIHSNQASRRISRLTLAVNQLNG